MLVQELARRQRALGMNDTAFAARLGIPRTTWMMAKLGRRSFGMRLAAASVRAFPDMRDQVVSFLLSDDMGVPASDDRAPVEVAV